MSDTITPVKNVGDLAVARGIITPEQLDQAKTTAAKENAFLEDVFAAMEGLSGEDLAKMAGEVYGMPYVDLTGKKVPFTVLSKFPEEIARKYNMVIFEMPSEQVIKVAVGKPWDPVTKKAFDFIREKNHINVDPYIASIAGLEKAFEQYKNPVLVAKETGQEQQQPAFAAGPNIPKPAGTATGTKPETAPTEESKADSTLADLVKEDITTSAILQDLISNSAIPRIVAATIKYAVSSGASDIHVEPNDKADTRIRFRIDGVLHQIATLSFKDHPAFVSRVKILAKLKIDEQRVPQDGRIDVIFGQREIDLRISTFPTINGEKVVMRILDKGGGVIKLEQLGMMGKSFDYFVNAIKIPHGILLVTGPTGSGKSTTLYAAIAQLNKEGVNIVTLEDPVEYQINGISQSQVKPYIGYSFAQGLRSILRQDPNIIMVGEIRDKETAEMAVQSALTGHLVLSTLHTNDAAGAIPRLVDMGVEPFLISSSLHTVIAQRLVRKICDFCKAPANVPAAVLEDIKTEYAKIPDQYKQNIALDPGKILQGKGCGKCNNSGYKGRLGIYELLPVTEEVQKLTIQRSSSTAILNQAIKEGMIIMKQDGVLKVLQGITTMEEVYRVTSI
ncbi:Flp pilus assembly complex ATPase component TadA [Candidatus Microgenomates bacterium]|nr:Flp pilus assembly complex ATPase component TadA [Candidatus Microgenomates bacterium]